MSRNGRIGSLLRRSADIPVRGRGLRAFSLMELMVVLALIGIMTAMIIPQMKGTYEEALLRSTGRTLVDVFNLASSHAITLGQPHRVHLDPKQGRYSIERVAKPAEPGTEPARPRDIPGGEGRLDTRIAIEIRKAGEEPEEKSAFLSGEELRDPKRAEAITFFPDGTAEEAELSLRDPSGFRLLLRINPITARVRIAEPERE